MLKHEYIKAKEPKSSIIAETIVLIHGFGGNHRIWKHQMELLSKYYNILAIDLPSHVDGNIKLSEMQVSLDAIAKKIVEVLDFYGVKKAPFMGVSMGTVFVKYLEVYYPEYVSFSILVGAFATVNIVLKECVHIFARIGDKLPFKFVYSLFSFIIMPRRDSKKSRDIFRQCAIALNEKEFKLYMKIFTQAFKFNDRFKDLKHIKNIYISGDKDNCFLNGVLKEVIGTHSRFIEFKNCGHVCNIDKQEKFNKVMLELLKHRKNDDLVGSTV